MSDEPTRGARAPTHTRAHLAGASLESPAPVQQLRVLPLLPPAPRPAPCALLSPHEPLGALRACGPLRRRIRLRAGAGRGRRRHVRRYPHKAPSIYTLMPEKLKHARKCTRVAVYGPEKLKKRIRPHSCTRERIRNEPTRRRRCAGIGASPLLPISNTPRAHALSRGYASAQPAGGARTHAPTRRRRCGRPRRCRRPPAAGSPAPRHPPKRAVTHIGQQPPG